MFKFTPGDIVRRVTKSRNLNSWNRIVEWWLYKVHSVHNDYVTLEWIVWNISSDSLVIYEMKVWDYVRRINSDYEEVTVWWIYKISNILPCDIHIEWSRWAYSKSYFEPVLTTDKELSSTINGIHPDSIIVDDADNYPISPSLQNIIDKMVSDNILVSNSNPITPMSNKTFNDYAIEAFMSDTHNREEATNTAKVLETLDTNLGLILNEIQKIRKVIVHDKVTLTDAMSNCNINIITRLIEENPAVKEFVERFMENKLIDIIPPKEKVSTSIADKFK